MPIDMEGIPGSMFLFSLLCLISLTNANTSPEITSDDLFNVCEDMPIGEVAFTIVARDADGDPLTYEFLMPNDGYFSLDSTNGEARVVRQLDKESSSFITLEVVVSDPIPNLTKKTITIVLGEANDNKPLFREASYDVEIAENTAVDTSLFKVTATDLDKGSAGVITYTIDEVTPPAGFSLFSIVPTTGVVKLSGRLNYTSLSTFYRLKINATDGGGSCYSPVTVYFSNIVYSFVTVKDIPDLDPQFIGIPFLGTVEENAAVGHTVLSVTAVDRDTGVNDAIIYTIEETTAAGLFQINPNDGSITVLSDIDREAVGDSVILTVKATESKQNINGVFASTTTNVQINILDVNDNTPDFYKCEDELTCEKASHFTGEVLEHSLGSVSFNMMVKDPDKIPRIQLRLEGTDKDVFSVEPQFTMSNSIVQFLVKQPQKLDFEKTQRMVLEVIAVDEEKPTYISTATVTIDITDANDNSPRFSKDTFKLSVEEHSPVGTIIANITAEDPDTMDQGNITYKLLPESILVYFDVDPKTGSVFVKSQTLLDREVRSLYSATLQARDTDGKPGSTVLEITVTDINDEPPVINRESYLVFVPEGGQLELKIEATDADDSETANSQIVFGIVPSMYSENFTINPDTGVLKNSGELDREALDPDLNGRIELNITATDKGTPPLSSWVKVIVNVEDVNDNVPQFAAPTYTFSVKEGEKGAFVGSVYADDEDQTTDFNRISFSIIDGSFGSFIIRSYVDGRGYRGDITVDPDIELDYESARKEFTLRVEATDLELKKAEVTVKVKVLDVNDERPEFMPIDPVNVKENTTITGVIGTFLGDDKDGNYSLIYELESIKCRCNGSLTPCDSFILDPSGEVRVNPDSTLDYEQCDQAVIDAWVIDELTEKGENHSVTTGKMVINIEDINDNAPEFIYSDSVFVVVSESASKGTSVAGVTATDRDTGVNSQIQFQVAKVQFENTNNQTSVMRILFEAVTTQQNNYYVGIIQTTEGLDMTLKGKYLVTVTATDTGDLSSTTVLEIFTVDERFKVTLEFTSSEAEVEKNLNDIKRALTAATKTAVEIVSIKAGPAPESREADSTFIVAYFVYSNGTALTATEVERMLSDPDHYLVLEGLGLKNIDKAPVPETETDPVKYVLLGMVGGLVIVLAVLITSLMCTRRNYRRKLKAAKARNSAATDNQKSGPVVPGTNKYTMEGANPVLNLNFPSGMILDMDDESSDVDKVSLNSLDDVAMTEKDPQSMMIIREEDEEETDGGPPEYIEPLSAALAQRGQKKNSTALGFNNPAFDTTDL